VLTIPKLKPLAKSRSKCPSPLLLVTPISSLSQRLMISIRLLAPATRQRWDNRQHQSPVEFSDESASAWHRDRDWRGPKRNEIQVSVVSVSGKVVHGGRGRHSLGKQAGSLDRDRRRRQVYSGTFLHPASPCGCALRDVATGKGAVRPGVVPAFTVSQLSSSSPRTRLRRFPEIHPKTFLESGGLLPAARPSQDLSQAPRHDLTCSLLVVQDLE
jgi:hypothetical protein